MRFPALEADSSVLIDAFLLFQIRWIFYIVFLEQHFLSTVGYDLRP